MINTYFSAQGRLRAECGSSEDLRSAVWLDLVEPTKDEERDIEAAIGVDVPTLEEMEEIELSSRLYYEGSTAFMTATLPSRADTDEPLLAPVTFILTETQLVSVRYNEPRAFKTLPLRAAKAPVAGEDGASVLVVLLEFQVDRLADVLERAGRQIHDLSRQVFQHRGAKPTKSTDFQVILEAIGRNGDLVSNIVECLASLERMFGFLSHTMQQRKKDRELSSRIKTLSRDCRSLIEHGDSLTHKVTFLLDATLGLINIEQNAIIKIFSVAAVVFLPPTLVASIYGMNFDVMPELEWLLGYPFALALMLISAVVPYWFFKRRGWL
ncbi:MAG: magnesium transporter CorA family protein [Pseudomonadales bacterium]